MYRGTTPTITINCDIDVSEFVTMWVTFRTQQLATYAPPKQVEVTKHLGDEGVDATDKVVTVSLTQAARCCSALCLPTRINRWRCRSAAGRRTGARLRATL